MCCLRRAWVPIRRLWVLGELDTGEREGIKLLM